MVKINKLKLTLLQQDILRLLFMKAGSSLNQNTIANLLKVTPPAVMKALPGLEKQGFISIIQDKASRRWAIELNRTNHKVMQLKRADNLRQMYESGFCDVLETKFAGGTIIVFGSFSRGDDLDNSDIDIAVIGRKEKNINLVAYEKYFLRSINIQFYESWGKIHKNLKENICNGIVLAGGIEL